MVHRRPVIGRSAKCEPRFQHLRQSRLHLGHSVTSGAEIWHGGHRWAWNQQDRAHRVTDGQYCSFIECAVNANASGSCRWQRKAPWGCHNSRWARCCGTRRNHTISSGPVHQMTGWLFNFLCVLCVQTHKWMENIWFVDLITKAAVLSSTKCDLRTSTGQCQD